MTGTRDPQQDDIIGEMLQDSGLDRSTELRNSLEQLRALVPERAPAPRPDLAALLASGALPPDVPSLTDRRTRNRRLTMVAGAVVGAMSLGAGAVAASSEDFRLVLGQTLGILLQPAGQDPAPAPAPKRAEPSPADIPAIPPAPEVPTPVPAPLPAADASPGPGQPGWPAAGRTSPTHTAPPAGGGPGEHPAPEGPPMAPGLPDLPGMPDAGGADEDVAGLHPVPVPVAPTLPAKFPGQP